MKKTTISAIAAAMASCALALPPNFTDDLDAAIADAAKNGKLVFACFSGSDWCPWCQKLDEEVFSKPEFAAATNDFNLVYIDLPKKDIPNKERNKGYVDKYKVRGFPSVLILGPDGKKLDETGYQRGGVESYLKHLGELKTGALKIAAVKKEIAALKAKLSKDGESEADQKIHAQIADLKEKLSDMKELKEIDKTIGFCNQALKKVAADIEKFEGDEESAEKLEKAKKFKEQLEKMLENSKAKKAKIEGKAN